MLNRLRFTPARLRTVERSELTGFSLPTRPGIVAVRFTAGKRRRATKCERRAAPRPSRRSRERLYADGAGGGQYATTAAKGKSRRWRDGDSRRDKAVTQLYRVTARLRSRRGSSLQAASWRAGSSLACAVAQRRRGRSSSDGRRHWAVARLFARRRASSTRRG